MWRVIRNSMKYDVLNSSTIFTFNSFVCFPSILLHETVKLLDTLLKNFESKTDFLKFFIYPRKIINYETQW